MEESQAISGLIGREVYTTNGVYVGEVEDLDLDLAQQQAAEVVLSRVNSDVFGRFTEGYNGVGVPYEWVRSVGDIILVVDAIERLAGAEHDD